MKYSVPLAIGLPGLMGLFSSGLEAAQVWPNGSTWKYYVGTTEASNPTDAWRALGFNDTSWPSGAAPVGYGEPEVATVLPTSAAGGYTTVYFRKTFNVANPADVSQLQMTLQIDDGAVVWINGIEVARINVTAGDQAFNALAATAPTQWTVNDVTLSAATTPTLASVLNTGDNIVAVHLINGSTGSSDLFFDGSLNIVEVDPIPPTLASFNPPAGDLNELTQLSVVFSEPVQNVDASDLLINGIIATSVVGGGDAYIFFFAQPDYGTVQISWNPAQDIRDFAIPANPFDESAAGTTWQYQLIDNVAPTISAIVPAAGSTVLSLTQIDVQFSEDVVGVNAADLLINNVAATTLVNLSPSQYQFQFDEPMVGNVDVTFAGGHMIQDTATPPNAFAGESWSYNLDPTATAGNIYITEFMALNDSNSLPEPFLDEDGEESDWIEIYNGGDITAELGGWFLTDNAGDLEKWEFPATNLAAGAFMVIFASEKDRRDPGAPLHTNFRLSNGGEFLALVRPEGTIAHAYSPIFPPQIANVSYGLPTASAGTPLFTEGAAVSYKVPNNDSDGLDWTAVMYNDAAWITGMNGLGFEGSPATVPNLNGQFQTDISAAMRNVNSSVYIRIPFQVADPSAFDFLSLNMKYDDGYIAYLNGSEIARRNAYGQVADSVADFSGTQGQNGWFYGLYNKTTDADKVYQANNFVPFTGGAGQGTWNGLSQQWTGSAWDLNTAAAAPWTYIDSTTGHPNGTNSGEEHWAIRRYVSEVTGTLTVQFHMRKQNTGGGNGVTGHVFHNGVQLFSRTIGGTDGVGFTEDITVAGATVGDFIDIALNPTGVDASAADGSDGTFFNAVIIHEEGVAPEWNATASVSRADDAASLYEEQDISGALDGIAQGANLLAIHGLNISVNDNDFLAVAQLLTRESTVVVDQPRYFTVPTPGAPNGAGSEELGPIVTDLEHAPQSPLAGESLTIRARISPTFAPISTVTLRYRVMYGAETSVGMSDNGVVPDEVPGDGVYAAAIPGGIATIGQMIRWTVQASDFNGRITRFPAFVNNTTTPNSPEYLGTIVHVEQTNNLPLFHWFVQNVANAATDAGTRASFYYLGEFYDNVNINNHGQSSRGFPKHSYDIDFHPGYNFLWKDGEDRVDDINLMTTYPDKAYVRNMFAYSTYSGAESWHHWVDPVRVQLNAEFYGIWHLMENGDDNWLERLGLDPNGALYKMYSDFQQASDASIGVNSNAEKKTRKQEGNADILALFNGVVTATGAARTNYMFDNVDIATTVNFLASRIMTGDTDCCHKNYYFYRDSDGTGEWTAMPWDVDLSFGRVWSGTPTYWDNVLHPDTPFFIGNNNGLFAAMFNTPQVRQMYFRRVRTLMDEMLQPEGTPLAELKYENMADEWADLLRADADLDIKKWGTWTQNSVAQNFTITHPDYETLDEAISNLKVVYLPERRRQMYNRLAPNSSELPNAQPANATIIFGTIAYNPGSNQDWEYIELLNTNNYAVDISSWQITGAVEHTFKGGTVIPSSNRLYVTPNVVAFRNRPLAPTGNQGRFAQGNYDGQLSARGETLNIIHKDGRVIHTQTYPGNPSLAQQFLRITEIMYNPAHLNGALYDADEYEYIELKNIGGQVLSLGGVRFIAGITFNFTDSDVTSLAPGETVLVVGNRLAFESRHGTGHSIAGEYVGFLDNGGENLRLDDADGEKILDFDYNDAWYPITDGAGFSLVIRDETASYASWDLRESWRPSGAFNGSPGNPDPAPPVLSAILINEALTHTDPPQKDTIEVLNTNNVPVNIGGWFLSDDFLDSRKYRIPDNTFVPANNYLLFDEDDFNSNPGVPPSFALSSKGDEIFIFSGDGVNLTGYFHGFDYGASRNGVSLGRYLTSQGEEHFVAQSARTLPGANALPLVGPVVVSEIMYHPPDLAGGADNGLDEYVELRNITGTIVPLFDPLRTTNTWRLRDAVDFNFPTNTSLAGNARLLVVNFDPVRDLNTLSAFRAKYGVPQGVAIYGPYGGQLDNAGESVELYLPDTPEGVEVPYVLVDKVRYGDETPWPVLADGYGPALVRNDEMAYGDDPINWRAAAPSAGTASATGTAPMVTTQPEDAFGVLGDDVSFTVGATGTVPLLYQWRFNGENLPGATSGVLTLEDLKLKDSGPYSVAVFNGAGATLSSNATLEVLIPAVIVAQPQSQNIKLGLPVTFQVSALSPSTITYQWLKNGEPINGANADTYSIAAVAESDNGVYSVLVTDPIGTIESNPATLLVLVDPEINLAAFSTQYPVVQGGNVTLSIELSKGTLPITYRWRRNFATLSTEILSSRRSFHRLVNVQPANGGSSNRYTCILTNAANFQPGILSPTIFLTVLADGDLDGLPDTWESDNGVTDPDADPDMDTVSNRDEYISGTDPNVSSSYLKVGELSIDGGVTLEFEAVSNRTYTVEYKDDLEMLDWNYLDGVAAGPTNRTAIVLDPTATGNRFYRLVTPYENTP